jgi:hypothetical protein
MLWGALVGLAVGLVVALVRVLIVKQEPCPDCGQPLPVPWFAPLRECPECGADLRSGRAVSTEAPPRRKRARQRTVARRPSRLPILVAAVFAMLGLGLAVFVLPGALESRHVWLYQEGQVAEVQRQIDELSRKQDPQSRSQVLQLQDQLQKSGWHPEIYQEDFETKLLIITGGGVCFVIGVAICLILWRRQARVA